MTERLRESLSALMDDEADDLELGRILRAMDSGEADLGATWSRYQLVSAVMKGQASPAGLRPLALDQLRAGASDTGGDLMATASLDGPRGEQGRTRRALGSFAVAASITAVAVVGWQWSSDTGSDEVRVTAAEIASPEPSQTVSGIPMLPAPDPRGLLPASEPGPAAAAVANSQTAFRPTAEAMEEAMRQQVEAYMVRHAEHNALHSRSGMMPFARMAAFDGAQ